MDIRATTMSSAIVNLRLAPRRMLNKRDATGYVGVPVEQTSVRPVEMPNGKRLWDIRDLDRYLDELRSGDGDDDHILRRLG